VFDTVAWCRPTKMTTRWLTVDGEEQTPLRPKVYADRAALIVAMMTAATSWTGALRINAADRALCKCCVWLAVRSGQLIESLSVS